MALICCDECSNKISEFAVFCPYCGVPLEKMWELHFNKYAEVENGWLYSYRGNRETLHIPDYITRILCENELNVKSIYLNKNIDSININAFESSLLENIYVDKGNAHFADVDGILFDKAINRLIKYPQGKEGLRYNLPETVRICSSRAFSYNEYLEEIYFPLLFEEIEWADILCWGVKTIYLPRDVKNIEKLNDTALNLKFYKKEITDSTELNLLKAIFGEDGVFE